MMLLLDTCTLLWLAANQRKLSTAARDLIAGPEAALYVAAITAFELGVKHRRGGLKLPMEPERWYEEALTFHQLTEIPMTGAIAARSAALPLVHTDPCDRIIVATAQMVGLTIVTPDAHIRAYAVKTAW